MPTNDAKSLIPIVKKIPIFDGLAPSDIRTLLKLCTQKSYQTGEKMCAFGTPSDEMYILLSGRLRVLTQDGLPIGDIHPITTVGEMGVVTGQPRSATVEAVTPSNALAMRRSPFEQILRDDLKMQGKVYRNVIQILSSKIVSNNVGTHDQSVAKSRNEARIGELVARNEILLDLLIDRTDMTAEEAESCVSSQLMAKKVSSLGDLQAP